MSEENVEIARRYLEEHLPAPEQLSAWVAGFWESDGDYYPARKIPAARPCHGGEEIVAFFTEWLADWEGMRYVVKEARAIGDDRVLVHGGIWGRGTRERSDAGGRHLLLLLAAQRAVLPRGRPRDAGGRSRPWA